MRCQDQPVERIESDKESGSQIALRNYTRSKYTNDGVLEWVLNAKESYVFPAEDRTVLYELKFLQYDGGKLSSELESNWGEINHTTKLLELKGKIHLVTPDRKSLKTEYLHYNLETQEVSTDEEVLIYSSGTSIRGMGLRAKRDLNQYTILKPTAITHGDGNPFKND